MNGAIAELWANKTNKPKMNSTRTIGVSHHHFVCHIKPKSSRATLPRLDISSVNFIEPPLIHRGFLNDVISEYENVHAAAAEGIERLAGSIHDRLPFEIERGVEQDRHAGRFPECFDESIISRGILFADCLQPAGAVDMRDGWEGAALFLLHVDNVKHKASRVVFRRLRKLEILLRPIRRNGRGERTERLAELDF